MLGLGVGVILVSFIICCMSYGGLWQILVAEIGIFLEGKLQSLISQMGVQVSFIDRKLERESFQQEAVIGSINGHG